MKSTDGVLVIEDNLELAECLREALESAGYPVVMASNGLEGLEALGKVRPCVILLDLMMPVMAGPAFIAELKRRGDETPVVVTSALVDFVELPSGVCETIRKPFSLSTVLEVVRRHC